MSMSKEIAFIGRATCYSPQSVDKDRAILLAVREQLQQRYCCREVVQEESLTELPTVDSYVSMGRHAETLKQLKHKQQQGKTVINAPLAVSLCNHRLMLTQQLEKEGIAVPPLSGDDGYWVKRGNGCRMTDADVLYAASYQEAMHLKGQMLQRGIDEVEIRAHVKGDWVKFYGVRGTGFFRSYLMKGHTPIPLDNPALQGMAEKAAESVALDVYGGDSIICSDGMPVLVDFNDWPSFSPCRQEAAEAIAQRIEALVA